LPDETAERTSRACSTVASFLASFGKLRARDASRAQVIIKLTKSYIVLFCSGRAKISGKGYKSYMALPLLLQPS